MKTPLNDFKLPITGIDILLNDQQKITNLKGKKIGLISSQSFVTADFTPSAYALHQTLKSDLICLFSLEHGWSAFDAAGQIIDDTQESYTGLPIYSLYGPAFKKNLSVEVYDI